MSTDTSQTQHISPFSNLSMAMSHNEIPVIEKASPRAKREPWSKVINLGAQPLSSASAGLTLLDSPKVQTPKCLGSPFQKSSSTNKRGRKASEAIPVTPKASTESLETVRVKMRESLAAALELVIHEHHEATDVSQGDGDLSEDINGNAKFSEQSIDISCFDNKASCQKEKPLESISCKSDAGDDECLNSGANEGNCDVSSVCSKDLQKKGSFIDDESSSDSILMKDAFLQANGLCWAGIEETGEQEDHGPFRANFSCDIIESDNNKPQTLASVIEEELFKLFGGVNKKYKEKGRSLLFNLKDRHNPELRQRVFNGDINPERLCAMSAEELASKELSDWRIAKAEELAQMVVLPDTNVKFRMVKKTHKGEYQVEVENDDFAPVEVESASTGFLPQSNAKLSGKDNKRAKVTQKDSGISSNDRKSPKQLEVHGKVSKEHLPLNFANSTRLKYTDTMEDLIVSESKETETLPPVHYLDVSMKDLASQPIFSNLQGTEMHDSVLSDENIEKSHDSLAMHSPDSALLESRPMDDELVIISENGPCKTALVEELNYKSNSMASTPKLQHTDTSNSMNSLYSPKGAIQINTNIAGSGNNMAYSLSMKDSSDNELVWEGLIQLNISSLVTAFGFHKSGDQASIKEWPTFIEIKGRVRLDAFEKFLQELRMSRNRAIMVMQFCWKEGSPESGRIKLCETADSYVVDERVGLAEPMPGLELYFCPPHPKTTQILINSLSKIHEEAVNEVADGLIGVLIWKKESSPRPSSHGKKHSKKHTHPRSFEDNLNENLASIPHAAAQLSPVVDEEIEDVPPGFGPVAIGTREEDDLPEFSFVQNSLKNAASNIASPNMPNPHPPVSSSHPIQHLREMILKYGSNAIDSSWKDDDDDIPEWMPDLPVNPNPPRLGSQQPPPPLPPNPYANQMVNQFPMLPHRPVLSPTDAHLLHHNHFTPLPWNIALPNGNVNPASIPGYGGQPIERGRGRSWNGWKHGFPVNR